MAVHKLFVFIPSSTLSWLCCGGMLIWLCCGGLMWSVIENITTQTLSLHAGNVRRVLTKV